MKRIFISSVQKEFAAERVALGNYLRGDAMMHRFFEPFLFEDTPAADRLEVWNPGGLPSSLTLERLRHAHGSVPHNPLLAQPLYLTKYIERMGTGTRDMIRRCKDAGLPEPEFAVNDGFVATIYRNIEPIVSAQPESQPELQPESQPELQPESQPESLEVRVLALLAGGLLSKSELSSKLGHKEISGQLNKIIRILKADQNVEQTIPDKPNSWLQKYRLTAKGTGYLEKSRSNSIKQGLRK